MKKWFLSLNSSFKTFILSALLVTVVVGATLVLIYWNLLEIPLGILLGGFIGSLGYYFLGLIENKNPTRGSIGLIILAIIVRFLVLTVVLIIAGVTYFKFDKHIFNLFAVIGGYLCPLIIYVIINIKEVKKK